MSQSSIGRAALVLTTNAAALRSGLDREGKGITDWAEVTAAGVTQHLGKGLGAEAGGGLVGGLLGKLKAHPWVAAGMAAGAGLAAGFGAAAEKVGELGKVKKRADVLGVSASDLQGMDQLLERIGLSAGSADHVFALMGKNLANNQQAAEGLAKLRIAPADVADKSLTEQFRVIADGINRLPKGAAQAAAAMEIFGRSGDQLLPVLQRGSKGIEEFIAENREWGAVLSDSQLAAAGEARKAWKEATNTIKDAWEGVTNRLAVAAAPVVKFVGGAVQRVMAFVRPVFDWFGRAMEAVGTIAEAVFSKLEEWLSGILDWLKGLADQVGIFGGKWPTIQEVVVAVFRAIGTTGAYAWDTLKAGAGAVAIGLGLLVKGFGTLIGYLADVAELGERLPARIRPPGLDGFIAGVQDVRNRVRGAGDDMARWGTGAIDAWGASAGKFNAWLDRALVQKPAEAAKAMGEAAAGAVQGVMKGLDNQALLRGSSAEVTARLRHDFGGKLKEEQQLAEQKKANQLLKEINTGVRALGGGPAIALNAI